MRFPTLKQALLCLALLTTSCSEEEKKSKKEDRLDQDNHFSGVEMGGSLDSLKNELADDRTDFLRSFGQDEIAWQKWDHSLLEKAKSAQSPILAFVGSPLGEASHQVGHELSKNPVLREILTSRAVCTFVDTHAHPEIKTLCYQLSIESQLPISFPFLIWLSHEGMPLPLAPIPLGSRSGRELEIILGNASALVEDFWTRSSKETIEQSRAVNLIRQKKSDGIISEDQEIISRDEIFRSSTRYLSSLYSFGDRDLDYIGGLIPTNSIELLTLGSNSNLFTDQVRARCRNAASEVTHAMIEGAIKDQLDGSFFFARRTSDWSLPSFSKDISSQAKIAHMLIRVGILLDEDLFLQEGLCALAVIEESWLTQSLSSISPSDSPDETGKFLWDIETLKQTLTEEELALALTAFSMTPNGNIPPAADPLEDFYPLNSPRRSIPINELANQRGQSEPQLVADLNIVKEKLLKQREKNTEYTKETTLSVTDLALVLKAQLARACHLNERESLQPAITLADRIIKEFYDPEKGLTRFPSSQNPLPARCKDYASTANAFFLFYQTTLDEKWLTLALAILDEAMAKLPSKNGLLSEIPESERIIPLRQNSRSMVFGDSSIGILDISLNRAWAITGDEKYQQMLSLHTKSLTASVKKSPVTHTDFIASCALGTHPLVAILKGNPNEPSGRQLLSSLHSQKYLPYLTIRAAKPSDPQPEQSDSESQTSITLMRNGQILGTSTQVDHLEKTLNKIIAGN